MIYGMIDDDQLQIGCFMGNYPLKVFNAFGDYLQLLLLPLENLKKKVSLPVKYSL